MSSFLLDPLGVKICESYIGMSEFYVRYFAGPMKGNVVTPHTSTNAYHLYRSNNRDPIVYKDMPKELIDLYEGYQYFTVQGDDRIDQMRAELFGPSFMRAYQETYDRYAEIIHLYVVDQPGNKERLNVLHGLIDVLFVHHVPRDPDKIGRRIRLTTVPEENLYLTCKDQLLVTRGLAHR